MSEQASLSFASRTAPADGVVVVFAEEGRKLSPAAQISTRSRKIFVAEPPNITGFKGNKEQSVDLLAPQGLKLSRRSCLSAWAKRVRYQLEDWLNLGGTVRGLLSGKEAPAAHIFLEIAGRRGRAGGCCNLRARRGAPRLQFQKIQDQSAQEERREQGRKRAGR